MFSKYYQSELAYLRNAGRAFGESFPGIAGFLTQEGADPDVERLLEGFAFLTARIHERADDCVPEMAQELAELLMPDYVRPLPAATMLHFDVDATAMRGRQRVRQGTVVKTDDSAGTPCQFRTTVDCDILPASLVGVTLEAPQSDSYILRMKLRLGPGASGAFDTPKLRFWLGGAYAQASNLWLALARHTQSVRVTAGDTVVELPPSVISTPGLGKDQALFPGLGDAERLTREYFSFAQKFLFFDIAGLEALQQTQLRDIDIRIVLRDPPPVLMPLPPQAIRLHCVPAVNLFEHAAIPLWRHEVEREQLLRADGIESSDMQVYDVARVRGIVAGRGERRDYAPFCKFEHLMPGSHGRYFRLRRQLSAIDGCVDTYLSALSVRGTSPPPSDPGEVLSVDLICTNRMLPARLRQGDIKILTGSGLPVSVRNVTDVTIPLAPPLGQELYWKLLAHMGLAHRGIADIGDLRQRLTLYNFQQHTGHAVGKLNSRRIAALESLERRRTHRLVGGVPVGGVSHEIAAQERDFASRGDAYLFVCILDVLLAEIATLNTFTTLRLTLSPSKLHYAFRPRGLDALGPVDI